MDIKRKPLENNLLRINNIFVADVEQRLLRRGVNVVSVQRVVVLARGGLRRQLALRNERDVPQLLRGLQDAVSAQKTRFRLI